MINSSWSHLEMQPPPAPLNEASDCLMKWSDGKVYKATRYEDNHNGDREQVVDCDEIKENTPHLANSMPLVSGESVTVKRGRKVHCKYVCLSHTFMFYLYP
jgi:hypothetical protein